jgi:hypothetical protein
MPSTTLPLRSRWTCRWCAGARSEAVDVMAPPYH